MLLGSLNDKLREALASYYQKHYHQTAAWHQLFLLTGITLIWYPLPVQFCLTHIKNLLRTPLGLYPEETRIEKDACTPVFIAPLFTVARMWKQPRCPLIDEWIRKLWYIYTMEYYSAYKKECLWVSYNELDEPGAYYTEWSKSERQILYINKYIWNLER